MEKRKALWLVVAAVLLAGVVLLVFARSTAPPSLFVPTPVMPHPNAFDFYLRAGKQLKDSKKINFAFPTKTMPPVSLAQKAVLVRENATALRTMRKGLPFVYQPPPARSLYDLMPYAYYKNQRTLARLLSIEGEVKASRGNWNGAVASGLDGVEMGERLPHGDLLMGRLVGIACQSLGRFHVWQAVDHLTAPQARQAARRLERIQTYYTPFADTMQEEKWFGQAALQKVFRQGVPYHYLRTTKRAALSDYTRYMDQCVANARQPYAAKSAVPEKPGGVMVELFVPVDVQFIYLVDTDSSETQNALLTVTLALRAYKVEHGGYPATLDALVPAYLAKVPNDPFALSGPLRYRQQGSRYVLYSVGPDGKDDGGRPIVDLTRPLKARYRTIKPNSDGDLVAGINTR